MDALDVIVLDFFISLNHCKSCGINVAVEATFIVLGTSVITPIKRRMGLVSSLMTKKKQSCYEEACCKTRKLRF
jgi:hypothetical protein